ncbi:MAG TPA: dihydrofolate reductase [Solirubrobacteraceae bacterium]|jgi:dihydrofolate reductase|nr:dihydrofolate reductase [Solirubrobacteraceae bacterium]
MVAIVVAHSTNRVIGREGALPWRLPSDLRRFRELTRGHTVLMGRRTYESLPDSFRPLPERRNLVLSSDPSYRPEGAEVFSNLTAALAACDGDCFVIGGEVTYRDALPLCERLYATEIEAELEGDAFFPELDPAQWRLVEDAGPLLENELGFAFRTYERAL